MKINIKKIIKTTLITAITATVLVTAGCQNSSNSSGAEQASKKQANSSDEEITLRFGHTATNSDGLVGLVGAAKELGYMEEELSKVNAKFENIPFVKAGPAINSALASDELDLATLGDVPAVLAKAQGADTVLLDVFYNDYRTDLVIRKDLDIKDVKELKGKKVAVQTGSYMQRILYQILEEAGLTAEDIEIVNMSEVDAATAIAAGSIDASPVTSVKGSKLSLAGDAKILYTTRGDNKKAALSVIIGRSKFTEEHPEVVEAFFKALIRASEATKTDRSVLRELYINSGIEADVIDDAFKAPEDYNNTVGSSEELLDNYQFVSDFLKENGFANEAVNIREWYNSSFYENAKS